MPERATISQITNIGPETTPGTPVTAGKRLTGLALEMGIKTAIRSYRATGYKYGTTAVLNKEWAEGTLTGPLSYTEIVYLLCGAVKNVTPTGAGTPKTWTFSPSSTAQDTVKTYTIEQGSSVRAQRFAYGIINGISLSFTDNGADVNAQLLGRQITDAVTLAASPTEVALVPVARPHVSVKLATTAAGLGAASKLALPLKLDWSLADRFGPVWALNESVTWAVPVEVEPKLEVKMVVNADAEGMGPLATMRANDITFMRIEAVGPNISGPDNHKITIDTALRVSGDPSPWRDENGVFAIEWTFAGFHDTTWSKAFNIEVVNTLSAL